VSKTALLITLSALTFGCASAPESVYWTKKGDTVVIHHVQGKLDKTEKLTSKPVSNNEATEFGAAKGQKLYQVADQTGPAPTPVPVESKHKKSKGEGKDKTELAEVTNKLDALKRQVKSLQEQVGAAAQQVRPETGSVAQQPADDSDVRLSQ